MGILKHTLSKKFSRAIILTACCCVLLNLQSVFAQSVENNFQDTTAENIVVIGSIQLTGNVRTREQTVLRELTFTKGESLVADNLMKQLDLSREHLMNTGLFHEVVVNVKAWVNDSVAISITMKERWYLLPLPALNLYDRNFNVWWVEHHHSIVWLQAGMRFYQKNLTGRNDDLQLTALFGFQREFSVSYKLPYFDYIQKHGLRFTASFTQSKNVGYQIDSNKELIYQNENAFQRKVFQTALDVFYKPEFNYRYTLTAGYRKATITDTIAALNPDYFLAANTNQQYLYLRFDFTRDYRDIVAYPLTGNFLDINLAKLGFGLFDDVNSWELGASFNQYVKLGKKWYVSSVNKIKFTLPEFQPYNTQRGLGYGNDYVSGYEYYAIDGTSWGFAKLDLKNELFKIKLPSSQKNPFLKGANLPFALYGKVYINAGFVHNQYAAATNVLDNTLLLGGGVGIDLVLFYDTSLRFDYSINRMGETGLYLHVNTYF